MRCDILDINSYKEAIISTLQKVDEKSLQRFVEYILFTRKNEKTIFVAGNGGSASTSSHLATDLMFGSRIVNPRIKVISLTDNNSIITATGNDIGFEKIFSRQLENLGQSGDLAILISASGNSPSIVECISICKLKNIRTIGLTGFDGGILSKIVDLSIHIPTEQNMYGIVEDIHVIISHIITEQLKLQSLFEAKP
jgi:D-sedoheptulose 7-phosphate isomerase